MFADVGFWHCIIGVLCLVFSEYNGTTEVAGLICPDIERQELNWLFVTVLFSIWG